MIAANNSDLVLRPGSLAPSIALASFVSILNHFWVSQVSVILLLTDNEKDFPCDTAKVIKRLNQYKRNFSHCVLEQILNQVSKWAKRPFRFKRFMMTAVKKKMKYMS